MRIFYSITDTWPPYRVDIKELFGEVLVAHGLSIDWFMARGNALAPVIDDPRQSVHLPPRLKTETPLFGKLNRLLFIAADCWHVLRSFVQKRVQLVQCRDQFIAASLAAILGRLTRKPFIYWCSYPFPEHHVEAGRLKGGPRGTLQRIKGRIEQWVLYRFVMPLACHSFVQSEQMRRDIAAYGVAPERMTAVPMGVPERLLNWARMHTADVVAGRVIYLGTFAAVRRLEILLESFASVRRRCPQATLYMVGDGDFPWERRSLEEIAHRLGVTDAVTFTGFLPIEEAWAQVAASAVCVSPIFPSPVLLAGSPTKLFEYMAMGRPVVCNTHPEQSQVIEQCGAGLCVEWGAEHFAEAIAWMLDHPEQAEAMGAKGPEWVKMHRTYPIIADIVLRKYHEILGVSQ